jgi:pimeloyl-ACP methyl ester carboxylesterase
VSTMLYASKHPDRVAGIVLVDAVHPDQIGRLEALMSARDAKVDHDELLQNREGIDVDRILRDLREMKWRTEAPLIVIAEGRSAPSATDAEKREARVWRELQTDLSRRSSRGELVVAAQSGHNIQNDQPDLVVSAIRQLAKR